MRHDMSRLWVNFFAWRRTLVVLAVVIELCCFIPARAHAESISRIDSSITVNVTGNDATDTYSGTGGLLLPGSFTGSNHVRHHVADCLTCLWRYTIYCMWSEQSAICQHAVMSCPRGKLRYRVWFGRTSETVEQIGSVCLGSGSPLTRRDLDRVVRDRVEKRIPQLTFVLQPSGQTLTTIPVIGYVTSSNSFTPKSFSLSGHKVTIRAKASYRWIWGDGASRWHTTRGRPYPKSDITHSYRKAAPYLVDVHAVWDATYEVAGVGTFPVEGDVVTQEIRHAINVRNGGTVLVRKG